MGHCLLHRGERKGTVAICREATMREREADALGLTREDDSYCDLFGRVHIGKIPRQQALRFSADVGRDLPHSTALDKVEPA